MNFRKKFTALLLAAVISLSVLTPVCYAADDTSSGTTPFYTTVLSGIGTLLRTFNFNFIKTYISVRSGYKKLSYTDSETGLTVNYNLYIPDGYDGSKKYPMITFIGDSGTVSSSLTGLPLAMGLGGIIWATDSEQQKHESFVLVPQYPETILDDHGSYTMTEYVDLTKRLIDDVCNKYSIDNGRLYATGQSMGCMTMMYLAAKYTDLFAAELFIDGQWKIDELKGLETQKFIYVAAAGDDKASAGQAEVKNMFANDGVHYCELNDVDAKSDNTSVINEMLSDNCGRYFISFKLGTVLPWYVPVGASEHMFSFDYGYKLESARDWLFSQSK